MKSVKLLSTALLSILLSGCIIHVDGKSADVEIDKRLTIPASDLKKLNIDAGAGSLEVIGVDGATEIVVDAKILTTKDKTYLLTLDASGSTAELVAEHNTLHSGYWRGNSPRIDLVVRVPNSLLLDVDDGSGDISINDMNNGITIDDGSGDLNITNIKGDIEIEDGSGSLSITDIDGNVTIDDGSDFLTVVNVTGDLDIEDGSGNIDVLNVTGTVKIDDGSGSINVNTAGALYVINSGSGGLDITNVVGEVEIDD